MKLRDWFQRRFTPWGRKTAACEASGTRYYGCGGATHVNAARLNVEIDKSGRVVAIWFRCQTLPFTTTTISWQRADQMNALYRKNKVFLHGVEVSDAQTQET